MTRSINLQVCTEVHPQFPPSSTPSSKMTLQISTQIHVNLDSVFMPRETTVQVYEELEHTRSLAAQQAALLQELASLF